MASHGARRLLAMAQNALQVIAIEWLCAAQGCDFHRPLETSEALEAARTLLRSAVAHLDEDRAFAPDIAAAAALLRQGALVQAVGIDLPSIEMLR